MHLAADAYEVDAEILADEEIVSNFLDHCPESIGMTKMIEPQVYTYRGRRASDWGVSGFVLIAESHVSVHTFPNRGYINVDIFSCKNFDQNAAEKYIRESFGAKKLRTWLMSRGIDYDHPRTLYGAMARDRVGIMERNRNE